MNTRVDTFVVATVALEQDAQLMLQVRDGCAQSFALLLERHRAPVVHYMYRMVQDRAVAEELAQEAFLRVYRARTSYEPSAKFTTWLYRIAMNLALNALRDGRLKRLHQSVDDEPADGAPLQLADTRPDREQELLARARLAAVREAIAGLPAKQRAAVLMHKYDEMDYAQIAKVLGCSVSAVKSLLFRAYESLRSTLAPLASPQASKD
jgi:RNA polymerase sigma-70 factor (ECF subfamily)